MIKKLTQTTLHLTRISRQAIGSKIPEFILTHRYGLLFAVVLLVCASVYGLFHLRADFSFETIFLGEDEETRFFETFKERFEESSREVIILIKGNDIFSGEGLSRIHELTEALEKTDGIDKVLTVINAPHIQGTKDGVVIQPLAEEVPESAEDIAELRKKAMGNRIFMRYLISEDGSTVALLARLAPSVQTEKQKRPVIEAVQSAAISFLADRYAVYFSGIPTIQKEYTDTGLRDMRIFLVLSIGIVCFFLYVTFRSFAGLYLPQITVMTSVLLLLGLMSLAGEKINFINNVIPSLLLVYGISDSIHLIHRYYEELGKGLSRREAIIITVRQMALACFMTSFTTAAGFLSLVTATIHIIKSFGLFAGIGIMIAYGVTIVLLPILVSLHSPPPVKGRIWEGRGVLEKVLGFTAKLNERFPRVLIASGLVILIVSAALSTRVNIESYILEELTEDNPIVQANHIMEKEMMGIFPYEIEVSAGEPGRALDPDVLIRVDRLQSFIGSQPWIRKTLSVVDILKEMNQAMHEGDTAYFRIPESRELVAQYLLLYEMSGNREDIDVLLTPDGSYLRVACQGIDMGTKNFFELKRRTEHMASELFESPASCRVTGRSFLAQRALSNVIRDMLVSLFTAFGIICIAISVLYRSLKVGLISMVPNIIPMVLTMGFMGLSGMTLRTSTVITFAISLGIAVDDTIHYITRVREELIRTGDYTASMYRTLKTAGRAIVLTTLIMISGFLVLLVSNFRATQNFGVLSSITLASALAGSLIFLPASINVLKPWKHESKGTEASESGGREPLPRHTAPTT